MGAIFTSEPMLSTISRDRLQFTVTSCTLIAIIINRLTDASRSNFKSIHLKIWGTFEPNLNQLFAVS